MGVVGLSDEAKITLYKYVRENLETEWSGLLLRTTVKSLKLG